MYNMENKGIISVKLYFCVYIAFLLASAAVMRAQIPNDYYGVHASELTEVPMTTLSRIATMLDSANVRWVRLVFPWKDIQSTPTQWQWGDLRQRLDTLRSHNFKILAILYKVPDWASSAASGTNPLLVPFYAPRDTLEWITYIDSTVRKFKDIVSHWEIWNEPDGGFFYAPVPGTKHIKYVEVLRTAYRTIKNVDPTATVLIGGLTSQIGFYPKRAFLDSIFARGAADYFDVMNVHFYRYDDNPVGVVKSILTQYNKNAPVWVTETNNSRWLLPNNTEQRAADSLAAWLNHIRTTETAKIFWFNLTDFSASGEADSTAWGLFKNITYEPTLVYTAYKNYISTVTNVSEGDFSAPTSIAHLQNYPNPFNSQTMFRFSLPHREHVTLKVFDVLGREVATLLDGELSPGEHSVLWNASDLSSGVYFCRLIIDRMAQQRKIAIQSKVVIYQSAKKWP